MSSPKKSLLFLDSRGQEYIENHNEGLRFPWLGPQERLTKRWVTGVSSAVLTEWYKTKSNAGKATWGMSNIEICTTVAPAFATKDSVQQESLGVSTGEEGPVLETKLL